MSNFFVVCGINFFIFLGMPSLSNFVNILLDLIWARNVCKDYQQEAKAAIRRETNVITFYLTSHQKLRSFGDKATDLTDW